MKKYVMLLVCAVLALSLFSGCQQASGHAHCVCNGALPTHICREDTWVALTQDMFTNATSDSSPVKLDKDGTIYRLEEGNFYLAEDIELTKQVVYTGTKAQLCINGKHMTAQDNRLIAVSGATLNITDCQYGTDGYDGYICGGNVKTGGAFLVQGKSGGTSGELGDLSIYSGVIKGGTTPEGETGYGGAIWIYGGTVHQYGGQIIGGDITGYGAAVMVGAEQSFNAYGGEVISGSADYASGVCVDVGGHISVGGSVKIGDVYLSEGCVLTVPEEAPLENTQSIGITMATPGVFLEDLTEDLSELFYSSDPEKSVLFDNATKTLSIAP